MNSDQHSHHSSPAHHSHSHDAPDLADYESFEEIEGLERFTLRSVGIDIGSATTHLIFSRLTLRRRGAAFSSNFRVTEREVLHQSPVMLTPYLSPTLIDTEKIRDFVQETYRAAGVTPEDIDTGAVIITGEALNKENAEPIAHLFAQESGRFICASAGPNHEALLAAHGCGAVALSRSQDSIVLNVDLGGGTTKLSLIRQGEIAGTAALSVGARLIAFSDSGQITRMEEPGRVMLRHLGFKQGVGDFLGESEREAMGELMAGILGEVIEGANLSPLAQSLLITDPLPGYPGAGGIDAVVFSGGVSEYLYHRDATAYGDLGTHLARHLEQGLGRLLGQAVIRESVEGIRATVIGAGSYTIQASGSTSHLSGINSLPAFGLQVVRPALGSGEEAEDGASVAESIAQALARFDRTGFGPGLVLALALPGRLNYPNLRRLAEGVAQTVLAAADTTAPVFIVTDADIAKSLGGILLEEFLPDRELVVVDGIDVGDLDFLDLGRPLGISEVVPVTVKSLVFPGGRQ